MSDGMVVKHVFYLGGYLVGMRSGLSNSYIWPRGGKDARGHFFGGHWENGEKY